MDERKKAIRELEDQKDRDLASVDALLAQVGEALLPRMGEEVPEYKLLQADIGDFEGQIAGTREDIARLKKLEEDIRRKEQEGAEEARVLSRLYTKIGELILEDPEFEDFSASYRSQAETLIPKIKSLEGRLDVLGEQENPNVFAWLGKSAQGMVLRSFLGKSQNSLQRVYLGAGEKYVPGASRESISNVSVLDTLGEIENCRKAQGALSAELALFREERKRIGDNFSADGGPAKKIQALERSISQSREQLRELYLRYGCLAAESPDSAEFASLISGEETQLLERAGKLKDTVGETGERIEKLKASLAIDEERVRIEKMEKAIAFHRDRIAESENAIRDLSGQIEESNKKTEELAKLL
jgi:hypothetical protein